MRSLALQLAAESAARTSGALLAHCAALDVDGKGVLIWGGPGSGRTGLLAAAMREEGVRAGRATTPCWCAWRASEPVADLVERKLYLKAKWVGKFPEIEKLLERSKLENMVVSPRRLHGGPPRTTSARSTAAPRCASRPPRTAASCSTPTGSAARRVTRAAPPRASCVLLAKDPVLPLVQEVPAARGRPHPRRGAAPRRGTGKTFAFLNPHLVGLDTLASPTCCAPSTSGSSAATKVVMLNMAIGSVDAAAKRLLELAR